MITLGNVDIGFNANSLGMEVVFDPNTDQQYLSFKVSLTASVPQLLKQLLEFQERGGGNMAVQPAMAGMSATAAVAAAAPPLREAARHMPPAQARQHAQRAPWTSPCQHVPGVPPHLPPHEPPQAPYARSFAQVQSSAAAGITQLAANHGIPEARTQGRLRGTPEEPSAEEAAEAEEKEEGPPSKHGLPPASLQTDALSQLSVRGAQPQIVATGAAPPHVAAGAPPQIETQGLQRTPLAQQVLQAQQLQQSQYMQINTALCNAFLSDNLAQARKLMQMRGDMNFVGPPPSQNTLLFHVLERGGDSTAFSLLLKARADVNAPGAEGDSLLHHAISHYMDLPPLSLRLLLFHKANVATPNDRGDTPLDLLRTMSQHMQPNAPQPHGEPGSDQNLRMRQLLNEVTEMPTQDIVVIEGQEVRSAMFTSTEKETVVFSTESSIGMYSMSQQRVGFLKRLNQKNVVSTVRHIAVNPEFGTIAVCLETTVDNRAQDPEASLDIQNVFVVWPKGLLQELEPLKLSVQVLAGSEQDSLPASVLLSRTSGFQMLVGRVVDGKVFTCLLNRSCSQLVRETVVATNGGLVALSDDAAFIAVAAMDTRVAGPQLTVYSYFDAEGELRDQPRLIATLPKVPQAVAAQRAPDSGGACYLAISEGSSDDVASPIEVYSVSLDGSYRSLYRLKGPPSCCHLAFCHRSATYILSVQLDGLIIVYDLLSGRTSMCHDAPGDGFRSICTDRSLMISAQENYFRIFNVPLAMAT